MEGEFDFMKPIYFDLTVEDVDKSKNFFASVLDWRFVKFPERENYFLIEAGDEDEPGINGGIGSINDTEISGGKPLIVITVPVSDMGESLKKVVENGGEIIEPSHEIPGVGLYATCSEPGGLFFGLMQPL